VWEKGVDEGEEEEEEEEKKKEAEEEGKCSRLANRQDAV
jgi:hypothetical protein